MALLRILIVGLCLTLPWLAPPSLRAAPSPPVMAQGEYALKAVFLFNFLKFIDWPANTFGGPGDPIVIGVIGEDPFGSLLRDTVEGEILRERPILVENYQNPRDIGRCHILFVTRSAAARLDQILAAVRGRSIVTVGETENFLEQGGMITLMTQRNRVRLVINPVPMQSASLDVSAKLLRVAEIRRL